MKQKHLVIVFILLTLFKVNCFGQVKNSADLPGGYLFAHMKGSDYGRLYYSISKDGLTWDVLNSGKRIVDDYRGHPDIMKGHDGRYYMIGVEANIKKLPIWVSPDLLTWKIEGYVPVDIFSDYPSPEYKESDSYQGAPKLFYDKAVNRYIITWHAPSSAVGRDNFAGYWCSMRTFYITSSDLKTFTRPARLFSFETGTIDVIIRKEGDLYYAFIKDECEATAEWPTGKSIRVSVSKNLTGPYSYPGAPVSPSYHEAPTVIAKPDGTGWYMYYEQYPGVQFGVSEAPAMAGPWFKVWGYRVKTPPDARHGCMVTLNNYQYEAIASKFGVTRQSEKSEGIADNQHNNWLFVSFKDPGNAGIWFATSKDNRNWTPLNGDKQWLKPDTTVGGMRDPFITRGPSGDFHLVWTCGKRKIGYAHSTDLVHWSPQRALPVDAANDLVQNTWAPELYYDKKAGEWIIFWSSTITGLYPETQGQVENGRNHRIFYMKTKDFIKFSDPLVLFDPGYPVIDATLLQVKDSVIMIFKDERRWPLHKQLRVATASGWNGPWHVSTDTITAPWTEGPSLINAGNEYLLYYDSYKNGQHMGVAATKDFIHWQDITKDTSFPVRYKHGSFLKLSDAELSGLEQYPAIKTD